MKKSTLFFLSAIIFFAVTSCEKNHKNQVVNNSLDELIVNDNFDWENSGNISFKIKKATSGVIKITSEDGSVLFHKGFFNALNTTYDVSVDIPKYIEHVLINNKVVDINNETIDVDLDDDAAYMKNAKAPSFDDDLLAYWQFNENSGNIAGDSKGNNDGSIVGADWITGINQTALNFNGTNGNVEIPTNDALNIVNDKISLSVWFKKDINNAGGAFIVNKVKYILRMDNHGKVNFAIYNPGWNSVTIPWSKRIIDTDWHNVVATYDGSNMKLYIDTVLLAEKSTSGNLKSSNANILIGSQTNTNYFSGVLDEVAIYTKALSMQEIIDIYNNTPNPGTGEQNLISLWNFNENSGNIAGDSENNNDGTISGAVWETGVEGSSLKFDGNDDYVLIPNADNLNLTDKITIMAWAKTNENKTAKIAQKGDYDGHGIWQDKWNGWKCGIRLSTNNSHSINWGNGIPVFGEWYHIALTYDGSIIKLFVNGQLKNTKSVTGTLKINSRNFSIGSDNGSQKFFNGNIDDVRIYGNALSQTEIQEIYNDGQNSGNTDTDGDGVQDDDDDYPNDAARAFNNYSPAAGFGSLAFEDLWPGKGDYDFNDLVIDYQFKIVTNASNKVADLEGNFVVRAIGAGLSNGFGFQFPNNNVQTADITVSGSQLLENYITINENGTEANQNKPTIIVFDNARNILQASSGFGVNVTHGAPYVEPDTLTISLAFTPNIYTAQDIDIINFNPFLIVDKIRGKEIHLPDYAPTTLADVSYFGTMNDDSDPNTGKYYKTVNNLPWAIKIPEAYNYTNEKKEITSGHLKFYYWAASSGNDFPDWYKDKPGYRNDANIYSAP